MHLNYEQKSIVKRWMKSYAMMYNETVKLIKTETYKNRQNEKINESAKKANTKTNIKSKTGKKTKTSNKPKSKTKPETKTGTKTKTSNKPKSKTKPETKLKTKSVKKPVSCHNWKNLRTHHLSDIRNDIIKKSQLPNCDLDTKVKCHMLDGAIKLACANYKSAISNFKRGHIKKFRIRYWKYDKPLQIVDIERQYFKQGTICKKQLGNIKCSYDGDEYELNEHNIKSDCKIHYDSDTEQFTLLVPEEINVNELIKHTENVVSFDPGLRCFMTGLSKNEVIKIGHDVYNKIEKKLKRIDEIKNNERIPDKKKKKSILKLNKKLSELVDEMQWKVIKYITDNYDTILIGD